LPLVIFGRDTGATMMVFTRRHHAERYLFAVGGAAIMLVMKRVVRRAAPRKAIEALADRIPTPVGVSVALLGVLGVFLWPFLIIALARR
jgi:hypothetical protein